MRKYVTIITRETHVSGNKKHGTIYPAFSHISVPSHISEGENITETIIRKCTIEDGTFSFASRSAGYTGQHTDIQPTGKHTIEKHPDGEIVTSDSPYIIFNGYSRNKYGGRTFKGRLNCDTGRIERPIHRGEKVFWTDFNPSNYID